MGFDLTTLELLPTLPGVYLMKSSSGAILYVGKAKELRQRVRQYFIPGRDSRVTVPFLVENIATIDTIIVTSEREALLLEQTLIQKHRPKYNALFKDDKSYLAFKLERHSPWPRLQLVRYRGGATDDALYFGPYTSGLAVRHTQELLQRLFPLRQCSDAEFARRSRPCILYDMKRCKAPCVGKCTVEEYQKDVESTIAILKGQDKQVIRDLTAEMYRKAAALEFEQAHSLLQGIRALESHRESQHVALLPGGELDAIALYRLGHEVVVAQLFVRGGRVTGLRTFSFSNTVEDDEELLSSFLLQEYSGGGGVCPEIAVAIPLHEAKLLSELLATVIYTPQRGAKRSLIDLAAANAKNTFHQAKELQTVRQSTLLALQEELKLAHYPQRIECFDNSHLSGSDCVAAMVTYVDGVYDKRRCRTYKLEVSPGDDYGALRAVLRRRYGPGKEEPPDLLLVDGGKGHLQVAKETLADLNIAIVDIAAVAKEEGRHDRGATQERLFLPGHQQPILLPSHSPVLFLLQQIRDEAHRVALRFQKQRRSKSTLRSALDGIPGIGPVKKKALLTHFGSVRAIKAASVEELSHVPGINSSLAAVLYKSFHD